MQKLDWKRNYNREGMRGKEEPAFEWYSADWFVIGCHVHNKTAGGRWAIIIRGVREICPTRTYDTKKHAFEAVENKIDRYCRDALMLQQSDPA